MNGPGHYREAERYEQIAADYQAGTKDQMAALAFAQVHATLALAAATALQPRQFLTVEYRDRIAAPWIEVAG